jgi:hypothetical protein
MTPTSAQVAKRERQREARLRRKEARRRIAVVYHGTCATCRPSIEAHGCQPRSYGPWVTTDQHRALRYAVRAVCVALVEADCAARPEEAPAGLLLTITVDEAELEPDPAHPDDYLIRGGVPPESISMAEFDFRPYLPDEHGIRRFAALAGMAREWEQMRQRMLREPSPEPVRGIPEFGLDRRPKAVL